MAFKVGLTRDLLTPDGNPSFGAAALQTLDNASEIEWEYLADNCTEITPDMAAAYDGLYVNTPLVTAATVARDDCRVKIVARHGVGYDSVDVAALAAKGVVVTNTPEAIRRPVAVASITMITALAGRLFAKDRITRSNDWGQRTAHMGIGLIGRRLCVVGIGGIGKELLRMVAPFEFDLLAVDPVTDTATIEALGARHVSLQEGLKQADFVVVCCLLNDETFHLIGKAELALMKPEAFLINMARGPVVDEAALIAALQAKQIAGAGLDVFEQEPTAPDNPLLAMDQVILTPHSLCWTDQCFHDIASDGLGCIVDIAQGRRPRFVVPGSA
ncbi:MAG: NAD(P)-dependent oxidoreductase [Burkholderiaceae bacterium]